MEIQQQVFILLLIPQLRYDSSLAEGDGGFHKCKGCFPCQGSEEAYSMWYLTSTKQQPVFLHWRRVCCWWVYELSADA